VSPSNIAHHWAAMQKRDKMSNRVQYVVKSEYVDLQTYLERYLNHMPSSEPSLWRRYHASVYNDRLFEERQHKFRCRPYTRKPLEGLA
jgi:hypothetical protein